MILSKLYINLIDYKNHNSYIVQVFTFIKGYIMSSDITYPNPVLQCDDRYWKAIRYTSNSLIIDE